MAYESDLAEYAANARTIRNRKKKANLLNVVNDLNEGFVFTRTLIRKWMKRLVAVLLIFSALYYYYGDPFTYSLVISTGVTILATYLTSFFGVQTKVIFFSMSSMASPIIYISLLCDFMDFAFKAHSFFECVIWPGNLRWSELFSEVFASGNYEIICDQWPSVIIHKICFHFKIVCLMLTYLMMMSNAQMIAHTGNKITKRSKLVRILFSDMMRFYIYMFRIMMDFVIDNGQFSAYLYI